MHIKASSCSAWIAIGSVLRSESISDLFLRLPQANSPTMNGWHMTYPSFNKFTCLTLPSRKWDTHTDVSTRSILYVSSSSPGYHRQFFLGTPQFSKSLAAFHCN